MADQFTEISSQSWFSRIGGAIKGVLFGFVLFALAFPLLFWNEGRAVKRSKTLKEGEQAVESVAADRIDPQHAGKLVHLTGTATTEETVVDPVFAISAKALKLRRVAEVYQWGETKKTSTQKTLGGGTTTATTYSYQKVWSERAIDSATFKEAAGHSNKPAAFGSADFTARRVTVGAFQLPPALLAKMNNYTNLEVAADGRIPAALTDKVQVSGAGFYAGKNVLAPEVGDARISFRVITPTAVSLVAKQVANTFEPYVAKNGGQVELLQIGAQGAAAMFQTEEHQNAILTWVLRGVGFGIMLLGLALILNPLAVLVDIIPWLGGLIGAGIFFIAFSIAAVGSLLTVAVAWVVYRPLLGVALFVAAGAVVFLIMTKLKKPAAAPPVSPS